MKLRFFSDIHGNNYAFKAFIDSISVDKTVNETVFLGDFMGFYYGSNEIISFCREQNITCVLGNHDKYFLDLLDGKIQLDHLRSKYGNSYELALKSLDSKNIDFLRKLNTHKVFIYGNIRVYVCHGSPIDNLEGRIYPDTDLSKFEKIMRSYKYVVTGHTHHRMERRFGATRFLNPGSLGQQRDGKGCSYLTLDLTTGNSTFHVVEYPIIKLEKDIDRYDHGLPVLKEVLRRKAS